jgi:hypothetical protein
MGGRKIDLTNPWSDRVPTETNIREAVSIGR